MERLINNYIKYLQEIKHLNPKSIKVYIPRVKDMIKFCKFSTLNDIQNSTIIQLKYWLDSKKDYSNQYKNQCIASAKSFFGFLVAYRLIDFNPAKELKALTVPTKSKVSNLNEIKMIRDFLKNRYDSKPNFNNLRNRLIIDMMLCTGLRNTELRSIDVNTINPITGEFEVIQKGGTLKQCVLNDSTLKLYNKYLYEREKISAKDNSLFISSYKSRISAKGLERIVSNLCEDMNIDHLTPHSFRHMCGSSLCEAGVPIEKVAKILGHSSSQTTYRWYMHQSDEDRRAVVNDNPIFK